MNHGPWKISVTHRSVFVTNCFLYIFTILNERMRFQVSESQAQWRKWSFCIRRNYVCKLPVKYFQLTYRFQATRTISCDKYYFELSGRYSEAKNFLSFFFKSYVPLLLFRRWLRAGRLRGWGSSPGRVKNYYFSISSRPALGSTQPPIQWVPGALSRG
jgi:hypothetical protein